MPNIVSLADARAARATFVPAAVLRSVMGPRGRKSQVAPTISMLVEIATAADSAIVEGRIQRAAARKKVLPTVEAAISISEYKVKLAARDGRDCNAANVTAAKAAADALDRVGDLAIADELRDVALQWWNLADRVRDNVPRPVSILQP